MTSTVVSEVLLHQRNFSTDRAFCLGSASLKSPFVWVYRKKVVVTRRIFAELTLNLLLNKPFLAENSILENTKLFGKRCKCLLYRIENDLNNCTMCRLCVHRDMKHMKSSSCVSASLMPRRTLTNEPVVCILYTKIHGIMYLFLKRGTKGWLALWTLLDD